MKKTTLALFALLLGGCAGEYTFNSNLDGQAINDYFAVTDVVLYQEGSQPSEVYEVKGLVEGESCQARVNDVPASISEARTAARRAAADKGANGLLVKRCLMFEEATQACVTRAICVGQAILTPTAKAN